MRGGLQAKPGREERTGLGSLLRETKLKNEETELGTDEGSGARREAAQRRAFMRGRHGNQIGIAGPPTEGAWDPAARAV